VTDGQLNHAISACSNRPLLAMCCDAAKNVLLLATLIDAQPPIELARLQSVSICWHAWQASTSQTPHENSKSHASLSCDDELARYIHGRAHALRMHSCPPSGKSPLDQSQ